MFVYTSNTYLLYYVCVITFVNLYISAHSVDMYSIVSGPGHPDCPGHLIIFFPGKVGLIYFTEYLGLTRMRSPVTIS